MTITSILWDVWSPKSEVVPKKLHDQGAVFVRLLIEGVKLCNSFIKSLLGKVAGPDREI